MGDSEPLTHEEFLEFDAEEARLEVADWQRGCAAARVWLEKSGTPELLQQVVGMEYHPWLFLGKFGLPPEIDWQENGEFTRAFLSTLIVAARAIARCDEME